MVTFCRDIPSHKRHPDPGVKNKNPLDILKIKNPESWGSKALECQWELKNKSWFPGFSGFFTRDFFRGFHNILVSTISWLAFTFEIQQCPVLVSLVILTRILTVCSHSQSTLAILNSCVKNSGPNFKTWLENFRQNFSFPEWQLFLRY